MEDFYGMFHEPYYLHYISGDLVERLEKAGFQNGSVHFHFTIKYLMGYKPTSVTTVLQREDVTQGELSASQKIR